jgi:hypothetical protein
MFFHCLCIPSARYGYSVVNTTCNMIDAAASKSAASKSARGLAAAAAGLLLHYLLPEMLLILHCIHISCSGVILAQGKHDSARARSYRCAAVATQVPLDWGWILRHKHCMC